MSTAAAAATAAAVGLVVAWALTVPLLRFKEMRPLTPRDVANEAGLDIRSVVRHARCPGSERDLVPSDVVPVACWFRRWPGGHRAPGVVVALQVALPAAMAVTALTVPEGATLVPMLWLCVVVAAVAVVDARIWLIPWWMPWVGGAVGAVMMAVAAAALGDGARLLAAALTAAGAFAAFFVLWFVAPGRLGFGDVRLAATIGLFLGWIEPALAIWGILLGSVLGVVAGVVALARPERGRFAFGPALGAGALLAVWLQTVLLP